MQPLYLDNNATTQPAPQVVAAMTEVNEQLWGNPSSVHRFGQMVRQRVELARACVARLVNCKDRELIFTSGGTESNNLALRGTLMPGIDRGGEAASGGRTLLFTTKVEHAAVREPAAMLGGQGVDVTYLPVTRDGWVDPATVAALLAQQVKPGDTAVVSVQWANNETGVIQPIAEIAATVDAIRLNVKEREAASGWPARTRIVFHVDGTQAVGKIPVDVKAAGIDLMTFAAHKFHGPKGTGALYVRTGVKLKPQNLGGPQERDRRGGTENTPGIIGMGVAAELAKAFVDDEATVGRQRGLRDRFEQAIVRQLPDAVINSLSKPRVWNTSSIGFPRLEAEAVLLGLSERGLCASAGAACSSGSLEPSPVLLAMGIPEIIAHGSVRFSLSRHTTNQEIDEAIQLVPQVVGKLSRTLPVGAR
jgi:cysteine desulfurase